MRRFSSAIALSLLAACAHVPGAPVHTQTLPSEDVALARAKKRERAFPWLPYEAATFARARAENRLVLVDGAAEWCHWCHVMDETTYLDPEVGALIASRFVAVRVDIDERPDFAERYAEYGWPATIVLAADGAELGKFRGYLPPERMLEALQQVTRQPRAAREAIATEPPAPVDALGWIAVRVARDLDGYYDDEEGGWGNRQKLPIGPNLVFELRRAERGDPGAKERVRFTFGKQRALLDPVWGGYYQYSAASTWDAPHFEKRLVMQAENLEALARGASATGDASLLADARSVARYMIEFLGDAGGGFHPNQDADVGAHDRAGRFVDGHDFYRLDDAGRRAIGRPWVDPHVYARESAMAARALCALHEATGGQGTDAAWLARARGAVDLLLTRFVISEGSESGGVLHDAETPRGPRFLVDAAELGHALLRLHAIGREPAYRDAALRIAAAIERDFGAAPAAGGALFDVTVIDGASGVFGLRARTLSPNVGAARFLAALARATGDPRHRERARQLLAAVATPGAIDDQGRLLGEFLLALDEVTAR